MSSNLPTEIWQHVFDQIIDHPSLAKASLICHSWRTLVFPRLFETITLFVEGGPWRNTDLRRGRTHAAVAPLVRRISVKTKDETDTLRVVSTRRIHQVGVAIACFPNVATIVIQSLWLNSTNDIFELIGPTKGISRELCLVDIVLTHVMPRKDDRGHDITSLIIRGSSTMAYMLSLISGESCLMHGLQRLQITFNTRHEDTFRLAFETLCSFLDDTRFALRDLILQFCSSSFPEIKLGEIDYMIVFEFRELTGP
jgi:hypothetical protein